ncbi:MAG: MFS transporter [Actinomycetota bacterium]
MRPRLASRSFTLTCAATFAFYLATQMQVPKYHAFLRGRTGAPDATIGLFLGAYVALAVLARPIVGRELAHRQRRRFMAAGGLIGAAATAGYLFTSSLPLLFVIRILHGISVACFYTGAATTVVDIAPESRRGEALSLFSMFLYFALAIGPALGKALHHAHGFGLLFGTSLAIFLCCSVICLAVKEPATHSPEARNLERSPLIHRAALFPGSILMLAAVGYAAGLNFTADFTEHAHIARDWLYFPALAVSVIASRLVAGRASDRFGRIRVALPGLALFAAALLIEAHSTTITPLLVSASLFGVGFGVFFPTMMAFTTDRVAPVERGSAMATFTASFDVGFGLGSPLLGAIAGASGYPAMFTTAAAIAAAAVLALAIGGARQQRTLAPTEVG